MKILVAVKRVIDHNVKVYVKSDLSGVEMENVKMSMNPFDEIAVEEAVRLKEKGKASEVIVVSIGPDESHETLRTALAMGADRGILVETDCDLQPLSIAKSLKVIVEGESPDLVFMGKQAVGHDNGQTGQMLSALLGWGQGTYASKLGLETGTINVTREIDDGLQIVQLILPAVVTTDLRLNEPRYISLPNIMKAKRKPLETVPLDSFNIDITPKFKVLKVEKPTERLAGIRVGTVSDLVDKLKNEAKVI